MIKTENLAAINRLNEKYSQYYQAGANKFTHLSQEQFAATFLGYNGLSEKANVEAPGLNSNNKDRFSLRAANTKKAPSAPLKNQNTPPPKFYVNWNGTNGTYVTGVKDQGGCGSCWAFASIAEIESFYLWKHKLYLDLSEQQMVDCVPLFQKGNAGCGGGYLDSVGVYSVRYAIAEESAYPYTATSGVCNTAKVNSSQFKVNNYVFISDCNTLAYTLLNQKPIGICVYIDEKWQTY
jgi:hypothetical protein